MRAKGVLVAICLRARPQGVLWARRARSQGCQPPVQSYGSYCVNRALRTRSQGRQGAQTVPR
eukprot:1442108-Lingulodinium_polyedra.AAC.1